MEKKKIITSALISVYHKDGLDEIIRSLHGLGVTLYSTGGTEAFIKSLGIPVTAVEDITSYPSILGGRVKTLHPKVFGGILSRRNLAEDTLQLETYDIPPIDLVVVDLYPFEETVASGAENTDIIEKIDIGGISLIRAAAKNFEDVVIIPSRADYPYLQEILSAQQGVSTLNQRKELAGRAFGISSHYDSAIYNWFNPDFTTGFRFSGNAPVSLRYGENPHQKGVFYGNLDLFFEKIQGKELSYNNLLDTDAAVQLMEPFDATRPTFAIIKHNNACGLAVRDTIEDAWKDALAGDPVSAFGGVLISNTIITAQVAQAINTLFFEVLIAPGFESNAIEILGSKKNRILLRQKSFKFPATTFRSAINGCLVQERDQYTEKIEDLKTVTKLTPRENEIKDLLFANKIVRQTRSNTIVLAKNETLLSSGTGQTSRVDALQQAIDKAKNFGFSLEGAVMASDAFFPFPDCVEIAHNAGIRAVIQPGGSIKDPDSITYCDNHGMSMVFTGIRHFKH